MNKKTVLVTGSSNGLGYETILKFASNNYNVIITYLNDKDNALKLENKVKEKYNVETLVIKCDISNEDDIENLYNEIKDKFNTIDVLVNNAGIAIDTLFELKNKKDFIKILETNLVGTFLVTKKIASLINSGSIINVSSTNAIDSYYEYSLDYDASKAGLINLTHNLANHYSPNIRVNCVCPGWMNTKMNETITKEQRTEYEKDILLNRFADPKEVANVIYFLSTKEASYINDSIIKVDGGKRI